MAGVSVCMSVYGFSEYLPAQIESIIAQSTTISEIVVVEDFSGLASPADYLNEIFSTNNIRLVYLKLSMNVGPAEAFRLAISASTGDVIYLCDHDDIWEPNRIKNTTGYHAESLVVIANGTVIYSNGLFKPHRIYSELNLSTFDNIIKNKVVGATMSLDGNFARKLASSTFFYPMHDWVITCFCLLSHRPIFFVDEALIQYRRHPGTFTGIWKTSVPTKLKDRCLLLISLFTAYVKLGSKKFGGVD